MLHNEIEQLNMSLKMTTKEQEVESFTHWSKGK